MSKDTTGTLSRPPRPITKQQLLDLGFEQSDPDSNVFDSYKDTSVVLYYDTPIRQRAYAMAKSVGLTIYFGKSKFIKELIPGREIFKLIDNKEVCYIPIRHEGYFSSIEEFKEFLEEIKFERDRKPSPIVDGRPLRIEGGREQWYSHGLSLYFYDKMYRRYLKECENQKNKKK